MPYQVFNLPNIFGISNPQLWVIEKRPDHMLAPGLEYPGWRRMGAGNIPNAYGISNPQQWIVEDRPEVTWMPWFAPGGSMGRRGLGQGDMAAVYEEQIRTLTNNARELPDADELFRVSNVCYAQAARVRTAVQPDALAQATADTEKCIRALRDKVEASMAAVQAPASEPAPKPSDGIPAAVWAVGALGILGVVIAAASSR